MESFIGKVKGTTQKRITVPKECEGEDGDYVFVMPLSIALGIMTDLETLVKDERFAESELLRDDKARITIKEILERVKPKGV